MYSSDVFILLLQIHQSLSLSSVLTSKSTNTSPSKPLEQFNHPLHVSFAHSHSSLLSLIPLSFILTRSHFLAFQSIPSKSLDVTSLDLNRFPHPPQTPINICLSHFTLGNQGGRHRRWRDEDFSISTTGFSSAYSR